ncbi:single-stranded DNA-binding protein [Anaerococcus sp. Marseille-Q5996]|uniref:single-stranded DNA-binding protein n=1 Tax=Anaerococcus sp. Marseille-Q5996 TaxID=2972769 RepID=UPI0021C9935E|nr:single-stranded DNA-binding protein [Anaerococcus sp. Marseille-Q5996]
MNCVSLIGRLTRDLNLRQTKSGTAVVGFNLAVDRGLSKAKRDEAEQNGSPTADFISCQAWGVTAELLAKYCKKGSRIGLVGRIQTGSYQDKETGKTVYTTDVVADRIEFLDSANQAKADDDWADDFVDETDNGSIPF